MSRINAKVKSFVVFLGFVCLFAIVFVSLSCRRQQPSGAIYPAASPTVASLVPAATDLIVQIGAQDHLVGISNFDNPHLLGLPALPRVGDYQSIDWERLNQLHPDILIVFEAPDRLPPGLRQRAQAMHMQLVNIRTETIADIIRETARMGQIIGEKAKANQSIAKFQHRLDNLRQATSHLPKIRTLVIRDTVGIGVVGTGNFLDEAITIAGGENVIHASGWPDIDREMLAALKPDAIIVLSPEQTPQARAAVQVFFDLHKDLPAVKNHRAYIINDWYSQQSSLSVADIAEQIAHDLHPAPSTSAPGLPNPSHGPDPRAMRAP